MGLHLRQLSPMIFGLHSSHLLPVNPTLQVQMPLALHSKVIEPSGLQLHSKRKNYYNYEALYKFHICCLLCVPDWPIFKQIMTTSAKSIERTVRKIRTLKIFWKLTFMFSPLLGNWQVTKAWPDSDCFWSTDYYL